MQIARHPPMHRHLPSAALLVVLMALLVSLCAAQSSRQTKSAPSPKSAGPTTQPTRANKVAVRTRVLDEVDEEETPENTDNDDDDETAKSTATIKRRSVKVSHAGGPHQQGLASQLKSTSGLATEADGVVLKERAAPPSGIILQHQRQWEKQRRDKGGVTAYSPSELDGGGVQEPKPFPAVQVYEQALQLLNQARLNQNDADLSQAISLLREAARAGNRHALFALAELYEFGEGVTHNVTTAVHYHNASARRGNPTAQKSLAFLHDTGKGTPRNRGLAFLYYDFAAQAGDVEAQITMGYKHLFGHGTRKDCGRAADFYGAVAQSIAEDVAATGLRYSTDTHRLVNNDDASFSTEEDDVVQYWKYSAEAGDASAQVTMGTLHLQGAYGVEQNYELARQYFARAAEQGDLGGLTNMGFLHAKGYGVEQNNVTAFKYLQQAASQNYAHAQALLGYMYLHGMGVERNVKEAVGYFWKSAEQGNSDAILHLANCYFYGEGVAQDYNKALQYYFAATEGGNLLALFNLAQMHRFGVGVSRNCHVGVSLYKKLVERGPLNDLLAEAYALYEAGDVNGGLYRYELVAEMGVEIAQSNAAWMYDHGFGEGDEAHKRHKAFSYYSMAAEQKNPLAHLKMGDYHYYGLGTEADASKAAAYYRAASDLRDAQAAFNLGYLHQYGVGLPQDLHLAKRYYDLALELNADAYLAWALALTSLGLHLVVDYLLRGDIALLFNLVDLNIGIDLDVDTLGLLGLSVLLCCAIVARQYVVLVQAERRRRAPLAPGGNAPHHDPHPHQE